VPYKKIVKTNSNSGGRTILKVLLRIEGRKDIIRTRIQIPIKYQFKLIIETIKIIKIAILINQEILNKILFLS
jgi:hypothetical protein